MLPAYVTFALALLSAEPQKREINVEQFDKTPQTADQLKEETFIRVTGEINTHAKTIKMAPGGTYFGRLTLKLRKNVKVEDLQIQFFPRQETKEVFVFEYPMAIEADGETTKTLSIVYGMQSTPVTDRKSLSFRFGIQLRNSKTMRRIYKKNLAHQIQFSSLVLDEQAIESNRMAFNYFQGRAAAQKKAIKKSPFALSMQSVPRKLETIPSSLTSLMAFLSHRIRADIAYRRLLDVGKNRKNKLQTEAIRSIAKLNFRDQERMRRLKATLTDPVSNLKSAKQALLQLRFSDALAMAYHARNSGKLDQKELSESLALLGTIEVIQSRDLERANIMIGQAFCLNPKIKPLLSLPIIQDRFEILQKNQPCPNNIIIGEVVATKKIQEGLEVVEVTGEFGPDPYRLVSGGNIELWGAGGEIIEIAKIRAKHGNKNMLISTFEDRGDIQNYLGQILIRLIVKDVSGVQIAVFGAEAAVPLNIDESKLSLIEKVDWWVWALAGVAIVGAGASIAALSIDSEPKRGIGPLSIRF